MNIEELNLTEEQIATVQKYVQSETDKVRTDYSKKLKDVNDELAQYKPKQLSDSEKELAERIKILEDREREVSAKEHNMAIEKKLKAKGLPTDLAKYLNLGEDEDEAIDSVSNFFLSNSNIPNSHSKNTGVTKEQFKRMSYSQKAKLFNENPELYKALSK